MIFFTINQLYSFCLILFCGIISSLIYSILGVFLLKNHQNNLLNFIFKFIASIFVGIFLIISVNIFYFGQFNAIVFLAFFVGFIWGFKTLSKLLDFFEIKFYYICIKLCKWLKFYFERKNGSIKD